jgi:hypothetical protein
VTIRVLFLGEGTSDSGITVHVQRIATECGIEVVITDPLIDRLGRPPKKTVAGKLQAIKEIGGVYDLVVIHRDGDRDGRKARMTEIENAVAEVMPGVAHAPVIPIRMTEAWLLLDEQEIRQVAGNPNGKTPLDLPGVRRVESIPAPKAVLKETLCRASGLSGRRLDRFKQRFPHQRRQPLERIVPAGLIAEVPSWHDFNVDLKQGLDTVAAQRD